MYRRHVRPVVPTFALMLREPVVNAPRRPTRRVVLADGLDALDSHVEMLRRLASAAFARGACDVASVWEEHALLAAERAARMRATIEALPPEPRSG